MCVFAWACKRAAAWVCAGLWPPGALRWMLGCSRVKVEIMSLSLFSNTHTYTVCMYVYPHELQPCRQKKSHSTLSDSSSSSIPKVCTISDASVLHKRKALRLPASRIYSLLYLFLISSSTKNAVLNSCISCCPQETK